MSPPSHFGEYGESRGERGVPPGRLEALSSETYDSVRETVEMVKCNLVAPREMS